MCETAVNIGLSTSTPFSLRGRHGNQYDGQQDSAAGRHAASQSHHSSGAAHSRAQQGKRSKARHAESRARYLLLFGSMCSRYLLYMSFECHESRSPGRCHRCTPLPLLWYTTHRLRLVTSLSPLSSPTRRVQLSASSPSTATQKRRMRPNSPPPGELNPGVRTCHISVRMFRCSDFLSCSSGTGQRTNVISCVTVHDSHDSDSSTSSPLSSKPSSQPTKSLAIIMPSVKSQPGESTAHKATAAPGLTHTRVQSFSC